VFISARKPWNFGAGESGSVPVVPLGLFTGGAILAYATVGGTINNVNPGGTWPSTSIGRLDVDTSAGSETWTGLVKVTDGYGVLIKITADSDTGNTLTFLNENGGSSADNQILCVDELTIGIGESVLAVCNASGGVNLWFID
jgi:hypothetical protein